VIIRDGNPGDWIGDVWLTGSIAIGGVALLATLVALIVAKDPMKPVSGLSLDGFVMGGFAVAVGWPLFLGVLVLYGAIHGLRAAVQPRLHPVEPASRVPYKRDLRAVAQQENPEPWTYDN